MSKALAWIRKSKGDDEDIGLEEQRELVRGLAEEVAGEVEVLDLGIHTQYHKASSASCFCGLSSVSKRLY